MTRDKFSLTEDQLAQQLEKVHEALINSRHLRDRETPGANAADEDLSSAKAILQLIEQVKKFGVAPDEIRLRGETLDDQQTLNDGPMSIPEMSEGVASRIGRFEIVKPLGQGGYGSVFFAADPNLERNVAIKFPRSEVLTTPSLKKRFVHEAKSASTLSHPNIVSVYEAGKTGGVYFIAYEYVRGQTLDEWIKRLGQPVDPHLSAEIVAVLAEAISHAHDRGIIHRDLKPSNILLEFGPASETNQSTEATKTGPMGIDRASFANRLRIADFGLCKSIDEVSDQTRTGAIVGTPAYMSPEQTRADQHEIGPATDVYSLGVILFQLLTGKLPFDARTVIETIRVVQEKEPPALRRLNSQVPRDLEAICLKCLEKDSTKRYATAFELQRDLRNYLGGFPVQARPVTRLDRFTRWARRNPALASLGSIAAGLLVIALAATAIGWSSTQGALKRESTAKTQAEQRYFKMKNAIDTYFNTVCENPRFKRLPQTEPIRQELLQLAYVYYQQFTEEAQADPDLVFEVAKTRIQIGEILSDLSLPSDAAIEFDKALALLKENQAINASADDLAEVKARALDGSARASFNLGDSTKAIELNGKSIAIQKALVEDRPEDWDLQHRLAQYEDRRGFVFYGSNDYELAVKSFSNAAASFSFLTEENPDDPELALSQLRNKRMIASSLNRLGRVSDAESVIDEVLIELELLIKKDPTLWDASFNFVVASLIKASFCLMQRDHDGGERVLLDALPLAETLCRVQPELTKYLVIKNGVTEMLGQSYAQKGQADMARPFLEQSLATSEKILKLDEGSVDAIRRVAVAALNLGSFNVQFEIDLSKAKEHFRKSQNLCKQLANQPRDQLTARLGLANCSIGLSGIAHEQDGDLDTALSHVSDAIREFDRLRVQHPDNPQINHYAFIAHARRAEVLDDLGRHHDAVDDRHRSLEFAPPLLKSLSKSELALTLTKNYDFQEATMLVQEIEASMIKIPPANSKKLFYRLCQCYAMLVAHHRQLNDEEKVIQQNIDSAMNCLRQSAEEKYFSTSKAIRELKSGKELDALRQLPEFQQLVKEVTAAAASNQ